MSRLYITSLIESFSLKKNLVGSLEFKNFFFADYIVQYIDMENCLPLDATVVLSKNEIPTLDIEDSEVVDVEPPNMFDTKPNEDLNKTFNRGE